MRDDTIVLANVSDGTLELIRFSSSEVEHAYLGIPYCSLSLKLPSLPPGSRYSSLIFSCAPTTTPNPKACMHVNEAKCSGRPFLHKPFYYSGSEVLMVLTATVSTDQHNSEVSMATHLPSFLDIFSQSFSLPTSAVPWKDWGPPIASWLPTPSMFWDAAQCGQRLAYIEEFGEDGDSLPKRLHILDFNRYCRRPMSNVRTTDTTVELVEESTHKEDIFGEIVVGSLPYMRKTTMELFESGLLLLDEDRLLLMDVRPFLAGV